MSVHASHIPELDALIARGSPEKRVKTLERMTAFFLDGASRFNDDHVRLFDLVFSRLIGEIETNARSELSRRLAPLGNAPVEAVRRLAQDDDIAVAGPLLKRAEGLSDTDLVDVAQSKGQAHLLAISARARIAELVTDVLLRRGDHEVRYGVAANRGARLSDAGFCALPRMRCSGASSHPPRLGRHPSPAARWRRSRMKRTRRLRRATTRARSAGSRRYTRRASSTRPSSSTSRTRANTAKPSRRLRLFAWYRSKWWIG